MKKSYVLCCNDYPKKVYFDEDKAYEERDRLNKIEKTKIDSWDMYWHIQDCEVVE